MNSLLNERCFSTSTKTKMVTKEMESKKKFALAKTSNEDDDIAINKSIHIALMFKNFNIILYNVSVDLRGYCLY